MSNLRKDIIKGVGKGPPEYEEKTTSNGRPEKKVEGEKRREEEEVVINLNLRKLNR